MKICLKKSLKIKDTNTMKSKQQIPLLPVELTSRWFQILGNNRKEIIDDIRRERWEQWKKLALEDGGNETVDFWTDTTACNGCTNLDGDWCNLQGLPCTVNPLLTFSRNMIGMACGGSGRDVAKNAQLSLW